MALSASRRSFITGLGAIFAVPAIVRVSSLMPVKALLQPTPEEVYNILHQQIGLGYAITRQAIIDELYVSKTWYDEPGEKLRHTTIGIDHLFKPVT